MGNFKQGATSRLLCNFNVESKLARDQNGDVIGQVPQDRAELVVREFLMK